MADEVERMQIDLAEKLDRLCQIHDQPELYVVEHFLGLRNTVDYEAEKILQEQQEKSLNNDSAEAVKLNKTRVDFIGFLEEQEMICLEKIPDKKTHQPSSQVYASLKNRIGEFKAKNRDSDIYDVEEAYLKLARDLVDETHELERRLFNNQTIAYIPSETPDRLGSLLYLDEFYLNKDVLKAISYQTNDIYEETIELLNQSLVVPSSSSWHLKQSHLILYHVVHFLSSRTTDSKFFYLGASKKAFFGEDSQVTQELVSDYTENFSISLKYYKILSFYYGWNNFDSFCSSSFGITHGGIVLVNWNSCISTFLESLVELFITSAEFKAFEGDLIAKCVNLETLGLLNITADENIGVLLSNKTLTRLKLESDSKPYTTSSVLPKLDKLTFNQLSSVNRLSNLELYGFEIETIDADTFGNFAELRTLHLERNCIGGINKDSFNSCPNLISLSFKWNQIYDFHFNQLEGPETVCHISLEGTRISQLNCSMFSEKLINLTINSCQISKLSQGVFDNLVSLQILNLKENLIRHVSSEIFAKLSHLKSLRLDSNPIETIDPNSFDGLNQLKNLYIFECKLKSINNQMFNGLRNLKQLDLRNNEIEYIEIITESSHIKLTDSNMKPDEFELVKQHLFKDLTRLTYLKLSSNKFSKFDLNWLINLISLEELWLVNAGIGELNREARPGLLAKLEAFLLHTNSLSLIDKNAFSQSTNLAFLDLSSNKLEKLEDDFLNAFPNLESFDLSSNKLNIEITRDTFASCRTTLEKVNLLGNESVRVMNGALENMRPDLHLQIELSSFSGEFHNKFSCLTLEKVDPEALKAFLNSQTNDDESPIAKIRSLSLHFEKLHPNNQLRSVDFVFLTKMRSLNSLNLCDVLIESLEESNVFSSLLNLESLRLINNGLRSINRYAFKGLIKLRTIEISKNSNLSNIDVGLFRGLFRLAFVYLSGNNLTFIDLGKLLKPCRRLATLDLSNNQLDNRSIDALVSIQIYALNSLNLANNRLENMDFVFKFPRLDELDLSHNKIESIEGVDDALLTRLVDNSECNSTENQTRNIFSKILGVSSDRRFSLELSNNPLKIKLETMMAKSLFSS